MVTAGPPAPCRFLTLDQAAAEAGVTRHLIYTAVRTGALPAIKLGGRGLWRVERTALQAWQPRENG